MTAEELLMKFVLFIMLFITPPNSVSPNVKFTDKDPRGWTLQSSTTIDMSTHEWCELVADSITRSANVTATMTARAFCIPKDENDLKAQVGNETLYSLDKLKEKLKPPALLGSEIDNALQVAPPVPVRPPSPSPNRTRRGSGAKR